MSEFNNLSSKIIDLRKNIVRLSSSSDDDRATALNLIAEGLVRDKEMIYKANSKDMEDARENNTTPALVARLKFDEHKLQGVLDGIKMVGESEDPI